MDYPECTVSMPTDLLGLLLTSWQIWEIFYLVAVLEWTLFREWPWTHTVFFVLHGLVMVMKQHSYAFCKFRAASELH